MNDAAQRATQQALRRSAAVETDSARPCNFGRVVDSGHIIHEASVLGRVGWP